MTYWNDRALPYPVLSPHNDDYPGKSFGAVSPNTVLSDGEQINLTLKYTLTSQTLLDLIDDEQAEYVSLVACNRTSARSSVRGRSSEDVLVLAASDYAVSLDIAPYVVAKTPITSFLSSEHHFEFRHLKPEGYSVPASGILAVGNPIRVDLDPSLGAESVFDLVPDPALAQGRFEVDMESDHIKVRVNPDDKAEIERWRVPGSLSTGQAALFPGLYMHAVTEALRSMHEHEEYHWVSVLRKALEDKGLETDADVIAINALDHAQQLLENPLGRLLEALRSEEED